MGVNLVELSGVAAQPWKNGGGVTYPLLCWPRESDWCVRLSVANIDRDGPFSAFPNIARFIASLSGNGVRLGDPLTVDVTTDSGVYQWAGEIAPQGTLIDGATRDLNLMIDKVRARGELLNVASSEGDSMLFESMIGDAESSIYGFFTEGKAQLIEANSTRELAPLSLVWTQVHQQENRDWRVIGAQRLWGFYCAVIHS
jgi:uncharacterized protein